MYLLVVLVFDDCAVEAVALEEVNEHPALFHGLESDLKSDRHGLSLRFLLDCLLWLRHF